MKHASPSSHAAVSCVSSETQPFLSPSPAAHPRRFMKRMEAAASPAVLINSDVPDLPACLSARNMNCPVAVCCCNGLMAPVGRPNEGSCYYPNRQTMCRRCWPVHGSPTPPAHTIVFAMVPVLACIDCGMRVLRRSCTPLHPPHAAFRMLQCDLNYKSYSRPTVDKAADNSSQSRLSPCVRGTSSFPCSLTGDTLGHDHCASLLHPRHLLQCCPRLASLFHHAI